MKFSIFCSFDVDTASFRQMAGQAQGLAQLGHQVHLVVHPFKYNPKLSGAHHKLIAELNQANPSVSYSLSYAWIFRSSHKLLGLLSYFLFAFPQVLLQLQGSSYTIFYKPLPLSTLYVWTLKRLLRKGGLVLLLDDWEAVGGFANTRSAESTTKKTLLTFCEEWTPTLVDSIQCTSKILFDRMQLSTKTAAKAFYLSHGCHSLTLPKLQQGTTVNIVYAGTYKSPLLIQFLVDIVSATCERSKDVRFSFIGSGDLLEVFRQKIVELPPHYQTQVHLTGYISEEDKIAIISNAQIALLYLNDQYPETLIDQSRSSTKLFEYLSAGRVIIASDFGEPKQILTENVTG